MQSQSGWPVGDVAAVCFDLDGTLVDSEGEATEATELALAPLGRPLSPAERDFVVGHSVIAIYDFIRSHGGMPLSLPAFEEALYKARLVLFARNGACELPGAREVVRRLSLQRPCALVTGSTRPEAELMLSALQIGDCFRVTLCAGEYPRSKPSPDSYLRAAEALGVPASRCLAIEDSTAGIAAARAAGMITVAVRAGNRYGQDQSEASLIVDSLHDVAALLS